MRDKRKNNELQAKYENITQWTQMFNEVSQRMNEEISATQTNFIGTIRVVMQWMQFQTKGQTMEEICMKELYQCIDK